MNIKHIIRTYKLFGDVDTENLYDYILTMKVTATNEEAQNTVKNLEKAIKHKETRWISHSMVDEICKLTMQAYDIKVIRSILHLARLNLINLGKTPILKVRMIDTCKQIKKRVRWFEIISKEYGYLLTEYMGKLTIFAVNRE